MKTGLAWTGNGFRPTYSQKRKGSEIEVTIRKGDGFAKKTVSPSQIRRDVELPNIGEKTIKVVIDNLWSLINEKQAQIDEAFQSEGKISLTCSVKLNSSERGGVDIKTKIRFIKERIEDGSSFHVDEEQMKLFEEG